MGTNQTKDFFISYTNIDELWAEWIAWELEENGYDTVIQAWDFRAGSNFIQEMDKAAEQAERTIAVLSPDYLDARFTKPEWQAAFAHDPTGANGALIPVRVRECDLKGLLAQISYIDLVAKDEKKASKVLLESIQSERMKPRKPPVFPGQKKKNKPSFPNKRPRLWNIPYDRNPFFTGRNDIIQKIRDQLTSGSSAAISQTKVISGLGGIGKTQIAVEYAYRYRGEYNAVFWVRSEEVEELHTDFSSLSQLLDLPEQHAKEREQSIQAVKEWLINNDNWLIIFDNADEPKQIKDFYLRGSNGHCLITSRAQVFDELGIRKPISLQTLPAKEAEIFLLKRTEREEIDDKEELAAVTGLVEEFGYLPLAIEQAGAYILENKAKFRDYLVVYRRQGLDLLKKKDPIEGKHLPVLATWSMSFEKVRNASSASADILYFFAFLSPDNIPLEIVSKGAPTLGSAIFKALESDDNPLAINEILKPLLDYSFVVYDTASASCRIHRLLQEVIKYNLNETDKRLWAKRVVCAVNLAFPNVKFETWGECDRLLSQAKISAQLIKMYNFEFEEVPVLLYKMGSYLDDRAEYKEAEPLYQSSLEIRERALGKGHPDVAASLNNLTELYYNQGKYAEAEPLYQRSLEIRERALGKGHPDVAASLNNLAGLYYNQGKYAEAEPLYQRSLEIRECVFGKDHPDVAASLNNLAGLYYNQGKYAEAEPLHQRSLEIRERALGKDHPDVAVSLNNLAVLYKNKGKYAEAEPLYQRSLEIRERVLGKDHSDVANSLNNYADLLEIIGQKKKAEKLKKKAQDIRANQ